MEHAHFDSQYPGDTRFEEIEKILTFVKEGSSCQVVSLPGVGRSNILGILAYNRRVRKKHLGEKYKHFHFVYLNFSEIRKKPLIEAMKFIFICLVDSLRERKMFEEYEIVNNIFRESVEMKDELVWAVTASDRLALDLTMTNLEQRLPEGAFFRSHRGALVRVDKIRAMEPAGAGTYELVLDHPDSPRVPLARERARLLREKIPFAG